MSKVSILIPSRNELFLPQTVESLIKNAAGDIEVIAVLDGYWPDPPLPDHKNLVVLHRSTPHGMRAAINAAAGVARGDYLMKLDAHCLVAEGFDEALKADCAEDWLVIPRRYSLDPDNWCRNPNKGPIDYEYLKWPWAEEGNLQMSGTIWQDRGGKRAGFLIDDNMSFQGSCWFMPRPFFYRVGGMQEEGFGTFIAEAQDIGMKAWMSGGACMTNKKTWYAHLHKGKRFGRGYSLSSPECHRGHKYCVDLWLQNKWPGQTRKFEWLIEHFSPVPTWPADWRERIEAYYAK